MARRRYRKTNLYDLVDTGRSDGRFRSSEELPIMTPDGAYMGDRVGDLYHCFELVDGVYVSHFDCRAYERLRAHMLFIHGASV